MMQGPHGDILEEANTLQERSKPHLKQQLQASPSKEFSYRAEPGNTELSTYTLKRSIGLSHKRKVPLKREELPSHQTHAPRK
jgi:C1A family cysteine protease